MSDLFIQRATKHKGAYRRHVAREHGKRGFTESGTIKQSVIAQDATGEHGAKVEKEAVLARTLRRVRLSRRQRRFA